MPSRYAPVVGFDLGNANSRIGVARNRAIDIITNEVSNRATPSLITFAARQRHIGEAAESAETSDLKNTISSFKRLIGRRFDDPEIAQIEKKYIDAELVDVNGFVGVKVDYLGEPTVFSAFQLVGMYLARLRDQAAAELGTTVSDVTIAIPGWFTDIQRRAMLSAAKIAGLTTLRLVNDLTAVALSYALTKSDLPVESSRNVVFVDVGHSSLSVAVVAVSKDRLIVRSLVYDRHLGGRDLDYALVQHFAAEFKAKYEIDVLSDPKATFRLVAACKKLKKALSTDAEASLHVGSIVNGIDVASKLTRQEFEGVVAGVLSRVQGPITQALAEACLSAEQIDGVELVGGSSRVLAIKERVSALFPGKSLSAGVNADEAIANGATMACALLSPNFKMPQFAIHDINTYPVKVTWVKDEHLDNENEHLVFPHQTSVPSTKVLSFSRNGPFDLEASYAEPEHLPGKTSPWLGKATFEDVAPTAAGEPATVKVMVRLDLNGIISFEGAYLTEEIKDTDGAESDDPDAPRMVIKKTKISSVADYCSLDQSVVNEYREKEGEMQASDELVQD